MTTHNDQEHPAAEAIHETIVSWRDTPPLGKWVLGLGFPLFALFSFIHPANVPALWLSLARTLLLAAVAIGAILNARNADPFFRQVYADGCIFAVLASAVVFYGAAEFRINLAMNTVSVVMVSTLIGMAISFVRLRRA